MKRYEFEDKLNFCNLAKYSLAESWLKTFVLFYVLIKLYLKVYNPRLALR